MQVHDANKYQLESTDRRREIHFLVFRRPVPLPWPLLFATTFSPTAGLDLDDEESPFAFLAPFFAYQSQNMKTMTIGWLGFNSIFNTNRLYCARYIMKGRGQYKHTLKRWNYTLMQVAVV